MQDAKLTSWLNGIQMIQIEDQKIGRGERGIILQIHSGGDVKVSWRNIEVKEL